MLQKRDTRHKSIPLLLDLRHFLSPYTVPEATVALVTDGCRQRFDYEGVEMLHR